MLKCCPRVSYSCLAICSNWNIFAHFYLMTNKQAIVGNKNSHFFFMIPAFIYVHRTYLYHVYGLCLSHWKPFIDELISLSLYHSLAVSRNRHLRSTAFRIHNHFKIRKYNNSAYHWERKKKQLEERPLVSFIYWWYCETPPQTNPIQIFNPIHIVLLYFSIKFKSHSICLQLAKTKINTFGRNIK